jgi:hypothetical protein
MARKKGSKKFQVAIKRIKQLSFGIDESAEVPIADDIIVNIEQNLSFSVKDETIVLLLNITYSSKATERMLMNGIVQNVFILKDLKRMVDAGNPDVLNLPDSVLLTLLSISISHSRALLAQSAMGTSLQDIYIPLVNPDQLAKELFNLDTNTHPSIENSPAKSTKNFTGKPGT